MLFSQVDVGGYDRNFSYVVGDNKKAFVVDPCGDVEKIESAAKDHEIIYIINTHDHHDHIDGNDYFLKKGAKIIDEDFELEGIKVKMIQTPGHTEDSKCILVNDKHLITGDTLFVGKIGGTFYIGGEKDEFESLQMLMKLDESVEVWPGHDYGEKPHSTIGYEKKNNPFIRLDTFDKFMWLKDNWVEYKKEQGIK